VRVCGVDDVPPGTTRGFRVAGLARPILVANVGGRLRAVASTCPHEDVSLLDGDLDGSRIVCPGHGYAFDLDTGRCTHDASLLLPRHRVEIVAGDVYVFLVPRD
jgi:nitrite reductase/ring-hydroxylating ferredoxin subunit